MNLTALGFQIRGFLISVPVPSFRRVRLAQQFLSNTYRIRQTARYRMQAPSRDDPA